MKCEEKMKGDESIRRLEVKQEYVETKDEEVVIISLWDPYFTGFI